MVPKTQAAKTKLLPRTPRRKRAVSVIDLTQDSSPSPKRKKTSPKKSQRREDDGETESRLRRWRGHAPSTYIQRLERALSQRMFVLDRVRSGTADSPTEELTIAGTTGNIYMVTIGLVPTCTCPDSAKGNQCKHIIYSLVRVLKAPPQLQYQLAFVSSELKSIFEAAPLPTEEVSEEDADTEHPSNRKPISGDCPICFCDMADDDPKTIVWCKAACGNNVHKTCFMQWSKSSKDASGNVRCVYCRTNWDPEGSKGSDGLWTGDKNDLAALRANATVGEDGYANVAEELGLNPVRDTSTYHQPGRRYWDADWD